MTSHSQFFDKAKKFGKFVKNTAVSVENKWKESSTVTKACIIGTGAALVAPLAIIPALGVVGFTSAGVAAGSIAASMQTATTVSGSIFALCQSAGAVGAVAASTSAGVGLTVGGIAGGVTAAVCKKKRPKQNNDEDGPAEAEEEEGGPAEAEEVEGGLAEAMEENDAQAGSDEPSDSFKQKVK